MAADLTYQRAAELGDFEFGIPLPVTLEDGTRLCLVREGDEVFAVLDRCSHKDFALSGGDVVAPCTLECPWHGARFDVRTGNVLHGPATEPLPTFDVRVLDGEVFIGPQRSS